MNFLKDDKLAFIYENMLGNIAQYISISPNKEIRYIMIDTIDKEIKDLKFLIFQLINSSTSKSINIRSFSEEVMKGNDLVLNKTIDDIDEILNIIEKNCTKGKYSIINENIDINDGGISGVSLSNIIEFSPNDTPKCVEKKGTCLMDKNMGYHILKTVYGFYPEFNFEDKYRVEFSIHPNREGVNRTHTIIWEYEEFKKYNYEVRLNWPNRFSEFIGDKAFGLIIADYLGFNVPYTTVISRAIAPFSFGKKTSLYEKWIRLAPAIKEPGKYYTGDKWVDPFTLLQEEEKKGHRDINISSVLSQDAVESVYSGAAIISKDKKDDVIEGVIGKGDNFMLGKVSKDELPEYLLKKLQNTIEKIRKYNNMLGTVSIEWVYDGKEVWILQLNQIKNFSSGNVVVEGNPIKYEKFLVSEGLEKLRCKIKEIQDKNIGIELIGNVGICSHFGDLLRHANVPSVILTS